MLPCNLVSRAEIDSTSRNEALTRAVVSRARELGYGSFADRLAFLRESFGLVIDLDKNYQWTVIGYPSRKLAWVMSRKTTLDPETYAGILRRLKSQGYDDNLLVKVPQRP